MAISYLHHLDLINEEDPHISLLWFITNEAREQNSVQTLLL